METLQAIYIALAVFGVGVTIVDLFGALDHGSDSGQGGGAHGHGASHHGGDAGHVVHAGHEGDAAHAPGGHGAQDHGAEGVIPVGAARETVPSREVEAGARTGLERSATVARVIGTLRMGVYFSLGAGPTGVVALATGRSVPESVAWAAGAGVAIALLARALRKFVRRDLDSSFSAEDFLLEEAEITVPVAPGLLGKAIVAKFGAQAEVYVKATTPDHAFARGDRVRIIDFQDDCYLVEAADEEHLVH